MRFGCGVHLIGFVSVCMTSGVIALMLAASAIVTALTQMFVIHFLGFMLYVQYMAYPCSVPLFGLQLYLHYRCICSPEK